MSVSAVKDIGVISRKDLPGLLRHVADQIESGHVEADTVLVIASATSDFTVAGEITETVHTEVWCRGKNERILPSLGILHKAAQIIEGGD